MTNSLEKAHIGYLLTGDPLVHNREAVQLLTVLIATGDLKK
jgi:hypothetical protein